jgi:coenzyme Q-binding protein COQ10
VLPYAPEQLLALVGDVDAYPQFVPWITAMRTWNARTEGAISTVDAEAQVGFSLLKERFATRVRRDASLLYGPFKSLSNRWRFSPHPTGTTVEFFIEFAFKSRVLDALLRVNLDSAANKLISCFDERAKALYGAAGPQIGSQG